MSLQLVLAAIALELGRAGLTVPVAIVIGDAQAELARRALYQGAVDGVVIVSDSAAGPLVEVQTRRGAPAAFDALLDGAIDRASRKLGAPARALGPVGEGVAS